MSVSFNVEWNDGRREFLPIASHAAAKSEWREIGLGLGLKWIPEFYAFVPIYPDNLDEVLEELRCFQKALSEDAISHAEAIPAAERLTAALERLKADTSWVDASIG